MLLVIICSNIIIITTVQQTKPTLLNQLQTSAKILFVISKTDTIWCVLILNQKAPTPAAPVTWHLLENKSILLVLSQCSSCEHKPHSQWDLHSSLAAVTNFLKHFKLTAKEICLWNKTVQNQVAGGKKLTEITGQPKNKQKSDAVEEVYSNRPVLLQKWKSLKHTQDKM